MPQLETESTHPGALTKKILFGVRGFLLHRYHLACYSSCESQERHKAKAEERFLPCDLREAEKLMTYWVQADVILAFVPTRPDSSQRDLPPRRVFAFQRNLMELKYSGFTPSIRSRLTRQPGSIVGSLEFCVGKLGHSAMSSKR